MSNSASDFLNAIKSMAQSVRNYVPTNFTGLHDTPTGYESYTDGFFVVPSGDRLVYDTVRFLDNVSDAPENQLVDGYLKLVEQDGNLVLQWSAGTTEGEVNYSIDGATHFTGLFDTPSGYKRGYYVRVKEDENKLEYISSTGLAEDTASEIANVIAHEKLLDFTGLGDTPTGYQTYTDGFFVVPSGDRLVYDKVKFLDNVSDAPSSVVDGGFLKVIQDNPDDPFRLEWAQPDSIKHFTGLLDTDSVYQDGYFLKSSTTGIEYSQVVENVTALPSQIIEGQLVSLECELYVGCNGEWKNLSSPAAPEAETLPGCVTNLSEAVEYNEYRQKFLANNINDNFTNGFLGNNDTSDLIYDVCLFSNNTKSEVKIDETTYKWGMFTDTQTVNITATPGIASDRAIEFRYWTGEGAVFGDANSSQTTLLVDKDLSITGYFSETLFFSTSTFPLLQKITAPDARVDHRFGTSVSVDGTQMAIGAKDDDHAGLYAGAVYVYKLINNTWTYQQKIIAPDAEESDSFGASVSIDGTQMIIGAWGDDKNADDIHTGSVYVYELINNTWTYQTKVTAPDAFKGDWFGMSVSVDGTQMVVGAQHSDAGAFNSGSAYVYKLISNTWTYQQKIIAPDASLGDWFGASVSIGGTKMMIGSTGDDSNAGNQTGSVYVYELINNTWTYQTKITSPDAFENDRFGMSMSVDDTRMVIGSGTTDAAGNRISAVYMYELINNTWTYQTKIIAPDTIDANSFGVSVSIDGTKMMIGATKDDDAGENSGSVYIFSLS